MQTRRVYRGNPPPFGPNPPHLLGRCVYTEGLGWRFLSNVSARGSSRRYWPTWEASLPRWTGGLDGTWSEVRS